MEKLHFKVSSPESFIKLACTMLFEKTDEHKEWGSVWNEALRESKVKNYF